MEGEPRDHVDFTVLVKEALAALAHAINAAPGVEDLDLMCGLEGLLFAVDRAMAGVIVALTRALDEATLDLVPGELQARV